MRRHGSPDVEAVALLGRDAIVASTSEGQTAGLHHLLHVNATA
jgi:hypothetical protein